MCPDNHACEVQTLPVAIDFRVALMISSGVSFEDVFQGFGRDSRAVVSHLDADRVPVGFLTRDQYMYFFPGIFECIVNQVYENRL